MTPEQIEEVRALLYKCEGLFTEKGRERINALCDMAARYAWLRANLLGFCIQSGRHKSGSTNYMHVPESSYVDAVVDAAMRKDADGNR